MRLFLQQNARDPDMIDIWQAYTAGIQTIACVHIDCLDEYRKELLAGSTVELETKLIQATTLTFLKYK